MTYPRLNYASHHLVWDDVDTVEIMYVEAIRSWGHHKEMLRLKMQRSKESGLKQVLNTERPRIEGSKPNAFR